MLQFHITIFWYWPKADSTIDTKDVMMENKRWHKYQKKATVQQSWGGGMTSDHHTNYLIFRVVNFV